MPDVCACGCGTTLAPKTPNRPAVFVHGHNVVPRRRTPLETRFWAQVQRGGIDECWTWLGATVGGGYGRIWDSESRRNRRASEVALTLSGVTVPSGAFVCHHCDNPPCVNPRHLYVGDALTNERDKIARGRRPRIGGSLPGERNHQAKLTDKQVAEIRARYTGRRGEQTELAREYGVTQANISLIVRRGSRV